MHNQYSVIMADNISKDSSEMLLKEIRRLEQEKEELERRNRERQVMEQRLKELRSTVSSLKSGDSSLSVTSQRSTGTTRKSPVISPLRSHCSEGAVENDDRNEDLEAALQESRAQIDFLQSQLQGSPRGQKSNVRSREAQKSSGSSSEEDAEDVMSHRHKQAIQANRDILVENMIPDDIFNDLISRKILTTADVSRIKERNTREAVNEELLNNLCRRSDRAFHVFVLSLRKTLQEYLANRIDPPSTGRSHKKKRKRHAGEMHIRVDCDDVEPQTSTRRGQRGASTSQAGSGLAQCTCQEVEEQILLMAKDAFRNIRRRDATPASFEQFRKELQQTNAVIKDSMEIMHTLKILCRHGDITGISEGSIIFSIRCHSSAAARKLWNMYTSGALLIRLQQGFVTRTLKKKLCARRILLKVRIDENEYHHCLEELERQERKLADRALTDKPGSSGVLSDAKRRRKHEENTVCQKPASARRYWRPRQAFQEIARNQAVTPVLLHPIKQQLFPSKATARVPQKEKKSRSPLYNLRLRPLQTDRFY